MNCLHVIFPHNTTPKHAFTLSDSYSSTWVFVAILIFCKHLSQSYFFTNNTQLDSDGAYLLFKSTYYLVDLA